MYKIFLPVLALSFLLSCQTDLDIPFPEHEPKLTLNGYLVEDGPVFLYVTRSFSALETIEPYNDTSILLKNASVSVWKNGEKAGDLTFLATGIDTLTGGPFGNDTLFEYIQRNVYLLEDPTVVPKVGDEFEFVVTHPTYGEASVKAEVMPKPEILGVELAKDSLISTEFDGYQQKWSAFKIRVNDPGSIDNYYGLKGLISIVDEYEDGMGGVFRDSLTYQIGLSTQIVRDADGFVYGSDAPLSDSDFNGEEGILYGWIRLPGCCGYPNDIRRYNPDLIKIEIETLLIDANFGVFQEKRTLQSQSRTSGIEGAILPREPVSVVGNVEGGYGLLGSFNFAKVTYDF